MADPTDNPANRREPRRGSVPRAGSAPPRTPRPSDAPPQPSTSAASPAAGITVGAVLAQSLTTLFRNLGAAWLLGTVAMGITYVPLVLFNTEAFGRAAAARPEIFWISFAAYLALYFVLGNLAVAAISYLTFQDLRARRGTALNSVMRGLAVMGPVVGIAVVTGLATLIGGMMLVVPGLIVMTVLWVAIPAAVVERLGVSASLSRSTELTRGNRWRIFGLILLIGFAASIASWLGDRIAIALAGGDGYAPTTLALGAVIDGFFTALSAIAATVAYRDLRLAKEGGDIEQIAAIFD